MPSWFTWLKSWKTRNAHRTQTGVIWKVNCWNLCLLQKSFVIYLKHTQICISSTTRIDAKRLVGTHVCILASAHVNTHTHPCICAHGIFLNSRTTFISYPFNQLLANPSVTKFICEFYASASQPNPFMQQKQKYKQMKSISVVTNWVRLLQKI